MKKKLLRSLPPLFGLLLFAVALFVSGDGVGKLRRWSLRWQQG